MKRLNFLTIAILVLILVGCGSQEDQGPTVVIVVATPTASQAVITVVASPTLVMPGPEGQSTPGAADALPTLEPSPLPPHQESFDEESFWASFPLPLDAEVTPVVEGADKQHPIDLAFATDMTEPQVFDYYATWLSGQGWDQQAPTEAMLTPPHQRWRKDVAELLIEIPGLDEAGRTIVWVQVIYLVTDAPPQATEQAIDVLPDPANPEPTTAAAPTAAAPPAPTEAPAPTKPPSPAPPAATTITPANVNQLAEVRWTHVGPNTQDLAWSPAPNGPLAVAESQRLYLYDPGTLDTLPLPREIEANSLAFSPDGSLLAVTRYADASTIQVDLWRASDWTLARTLTGHPNIITGLAFSPDDRLLASASMDSSVRLWNVSDGQLVRELRPTYQGVHAPAVLSVAWSPDGGRVVAGVYGGSVQGWRVGDGVQVINFQTPTTSQPNEVHALPNGLLVTLNGYSASVWRMDGTNLGRMESEQRFYSGAISPDGQLLSSASSDGVELWDLNALQIVHRLDIGDVQKSAFGLNGTQLATLEGSDDLLRLWGIGAVEDQKNPTDRYTEVWARLGGANGRLGSPLGSAVEGTFAEQHFERGLMHWGRLDREGEPEPEVHVIVYGEGGSNRQSGDLWGRFIDYWHEGDAEYSCPEATPPLGPRRGFGLVWCRYVRDSLGASLEEEYGVQAGYQDFEKGTMILSPTDGGVYVLFNEGDWQFETTNDQ